MGILPSPASNQKADELIISEVLVHCPYFRHLGGVERTAMKINMRVKPFPADTYVCQQGEDRFCFYVVVKGELKCTQLQDNNREPKEVDIRLLKPYACFGCVMDPNSYRQYHSVRSITNVTLVELGREAFEKY